jgi:hypothetical protein
VITRLSIFILLSMCAGIAAAQHDYFSANRTLIRSGVQAVLTRRCFYRAINSGWYLPGKMLLILLNHPG